MQARSALLGAALLGVMFVVATPLQTVATESMDDVFMAPRPELQLGSGVSLPSVIKLQPVVSGLSQPVAYRSANDGTGRMFVVEQTGTIQVVQPGGTKSLYLDVRGMNFKCCGEQGLLGLAFHPNFASNGYLFVELTQNPSAGGANDAVIYRFHVNSPLTGTPDPASATQVMRIVTHPFTNHNGGNILFGPDGYLYWGMGDGGSGGDPNGNAQRLDRYFGKLFRIDVNVPSGHAVPASNPFVGQAGAIPEIWAYGLRNPWRWSFDRQTGDLWIGDVGQNFVEEVDVQPAGVGGQNYGWNVYEGIAPYTTIRVPPPVQGVTFPLISYPHYVGLGAPACAVMGGYVYRGAAIPALQGVYLYADYCTGTIAAAVAAPGQPALYNGGAPILQTGQGIVSFGEDAAGELYVVSQSGGGVVSRIVAGP
ncbi:MAG: PQQ-dependent sugar dehydrogenase [Halobacteriales archaeon]|nr:PQQ-dependent sugar dehydrogenase [Halobacteriales archaeon]